MRRLWVLDAWKVLLSLTAVIQQLSAVCCHSPRVEARVFNLERSFRLNQLVDLNVSRARDQARHARFTQGVIGGSVDFSLYGSSDPFKGG